MNWRVIFASLKSREMLRRIGAVFGIIVAYRFLSQIPVPLAEPTQLKTIVDNALSQTDLGGFMNLLSGGALSSLSIVLVGLSPYITASVITQLLTKAIPSLEELHKDGESGRRKINQWTRIITVPLAVLQSIAFIFIIRQTVLAGNTAVLDQTTPFQWVLAVTAMSAGAILMMWLGELITEQGIGNGISFIILVGIISRFPGAVIKEFASRLTDAGGGLVMFLVEVVFLLLVIAASIMLVQGTRKIPVQYAKRVVGNKQYGGVRQYIPLKINAAGVMPIIFAQAIMFIPITLAGFTHSEAVNTFVGAFMNNNGFWYNLVFGLLIIAFTYFYTAITINPTQMAEDMKRNNGFIPGIKPGKRTSEYLDEIMSRITLPGSIFLAIVAVMPAFASLLGINQEFAQFFGGTSLLILVGVVLDTLQQIESHLLMRHYDGLLKSG